MPLVERTIEWTSPCVVPLDDDDILWVDVAKLDALWRGDCIYIEPGGKGGLKWKYQRIGEEIMAGKDVHMPRLCDDYYLAAKGVVSFGDGTHRFSWIRDHGGNDVPEVHLQRLVYFSEGQGLARPEQALFERLDTTEEGFIREAEARATAHGITFDASGATEPGTSLRRAGDGRPWSLCTRPWTLMYFTAHGRVLPCCIAPFSMRGYDSFTLGDATQQTLREIWHGEPYRAFRRGLLSDHPPRACAGCGLRWSL